MTVNAPARDLGRFLRMLAGFQAEVTRGNGWVYRGPLDFLLREGRFFRPAPLPPDVRRGKIKQCYRNSFLLAAERPDLTYTEGYATSIIPVEHAWCVDAEGHVIDPTWVGRLSGVAYFGIPFRLAYIVGILERSDTYGILFNWREHFPLCTGAHRVTDAIPERWQRPDKPVAGNRDRKERNCEKAKVVHLHP